MGRGGKPPQQGECERMGKQVFIFLSLPGETAEKEPGVGGGDGGVGQGKVQEREIRAGMWRQSQSILDSRTIPQDVSTVCTEAKMSGKNIPPFSKKRSSSPFDCSL